MRYLVAVLFIPEAVIVNNAFAPPTCTPSTVCNTSALVASTITCVFEEKPTGLEVNSSVREDTDAVKYKKGDIMLIIIILQTNYYSYYV